MRTIFVHRRIFLLNPRIKLDLTLTTNFVLFTAFDSCRWSFITGGWWFRYEFDKKKMSLQASLESYYTIPTHNHIYLASISMTEAHTLQIYTFESDVSDWSHVSLDLLEYTPHFDNNFIEVTGFLAMKSFEDDHQCFIWHVTGSQWSGVIAGLHDHISSDWKFTWTIVQIKVVFTMFTLWRGVLYCYIKGSL